MHDLHISLDYEMLRLIWWALLGVILIGFAIMDGFDLGVASLLPFVAKTDTERRVVINTVGPFWEGNQVWLILGGGAVFAAWPAVYAVSFSGLYLAMFIVLSAIVLRPVGFKFRSKVSDPRWRRAWDACLFIGGFVPALLFGVAVGNVMQGVPFHFDETLRVSYTGTFFELLNPFSVICGFASLTMFMRHGAIYLSMKTEGIIEQRLRRSVWFLTFLHILAPTAGWLWANHTLGAYAIISPIDTLQPSNPLFKKVIQHTHGFTHNFGLYPWMFIAPWLAFGGIILSEILFALRFIGASFVFSSLSIFGIVAIPGLCLFPLILPSSSHPDHSLSVWDASSSHLTLFVMTLAAAIFMPLIVLYTSWVYKVLRGKVTEKNVEAHSDTYY